LPAGRRGHKIREFKRRIDAILEEERERWEPIPSPISEEHAELRKRIEEASQVLRDAEDSDEGDEDFDPVMGMINNSETQRVAVRMFQLMHEERDLLEIHSVD
jgi:hypothetical protein